MAWEDGRIQRLPAPWGGEVEEEEEGGDGGVKKSSEDLALPMTEMATRARPHQGHHYP